MADKKVKKKNKVKDSANTSSKSTKPEFIDTIWYQLWPVILIVLSIVLLFFFVFTKNSGVVGKAVKSLLFGFFSWGAWIIPFAMIKFVFSWKKNVESNTVTSNIVYSVLTVIFVSVFAHTIVQLGDKKIAGVLNIAKLYANGKESTGGGVCGGLLGSALYRLIGAIPTFIIATAVLIVFAIFMFGFTPMKLADIMGNRIKERKEKLSEMAAQKAEERAKERIEKEKELEAERKKAQYEAELAEREKKISKVSDGLEVDDDEAKSDDKPIKVGDESSKTSEEINLEEIFVNKENLELSKKLLSDDSSTVQSADISINVSDKEESPVVSAEPLQASSENDEKHDYQFPPISFLVKDSSAKVDAAEELNITADKLVKTLESFGVKTTVVDVSRGPTVTRYELQPQIGVKVRSIGNLVDDIALHLAAKGAVRIEAPIPGKSAVGIEIPNQSSSIVRLRGLIENSKFNESKSKLTVVLGEDVAGNPIYMNIAAMPHLLIAGATGMGKSVCINSLIISLLYKAKPDEVKLILIDPKKVELNMYNGIPHLIVPVVSDPKKAAGSLRWAVSEMEQRFQLMDECGARDLAGYNEIAENDPELKKLPEIVIIIDELADLMMTAPGEVEDAICRIAQKARAAGMHLVIGTQRPSVDVITGLIKANIPSRIAFTVASQIDSRTIIDIAGAEKLCGKGDMLYAPVGISKPLRVQGSFVSTSEVEKVCEFLSSEASAEYDDEVAKSIEKEAEKCGVKGSLKDKSEQATSADGVEDGDEMLPKAIEIAVEAGENGISTSMLQRRLAVGYARAGRLIDTMEQMHIIGGFEGSKPRKVLITREQYLEMKMHGSESESVSGDNENV